MFDISSVNSNKREALDSETQVKYTHLQAILSEMESVLVAYSGGVDSALLLKVAHDVLGERAMGAIASSAAYAPEETAGAVAVSWAYRYGTNLRWLVSPHGSPTALESMWLLCRWSTKQKSCCMNWAFPSCVCAITTKSPVLRSNVPRCRA